VAVTATRPIEAHLLPSLVASVGSVAVSQTHRITTPF